MITSITNIRPVGPGRLSFDLTAGYTGGEEPIELVVDGRRIAFRIGVAADEVRRVTVRYDVPNVKRVTVIAPASGIQVSPPSFDAEGFGMQFQSPTPRDIIYCDDCDGWHEQGAPC